MARTTKARRRSGGTCRALLLSLTLCLSPAAHTAAGDLALITNQNGNSVSLVDLGTRREVARLSVTGNPAGVAVGRQGDVYVVGPESKSVHRLELATGRELARADLSGGPLGVAYDPDSGRVFVSDWYAARVLVLDETTLNVLDHLKTGSAPAGLAVRAGVLATADRDADQVSLFHAATGRLLHRVKVGTRPFGLGFAPDGRLFVGNVGSDDVSVIDPTQGQVLATLPVGDRPYGVAFARGRAFVTNQYADTLSVIDLNTLASVATIEVGEYPEGIDTASDGRTLVVANWFSNSVMLVDGETLTVTGEVPVGDGPRAFGRFIAPAP